ncbi:26S proteasome non-ATPase regulatory subunit 9 [Lecanosticta acicola]|uniref:Probable 26S proteasome regulatory subunit p27 n=1 Tax=Lecanosticta acicola TaxID=111012 RepID=A0AAI8YR43_9PEZI|nr:26S proteasome non-ATPase regulatory subunit 9 [Lecanosticta acicola]
MGLRIMDDIHAPTVSSGPTSQPTANGTSPKQSLRDLIAQKDDLEAELSALSSVLDSHGVNMNTSLTTIDGFPRADIDVAQIRTTRARIIRLKNDHKALMSKLEDAVHEQFATGKQEGLPTNGAMSRTSMNETIASRPAAPVLEPAFAKVNAVVPGSPAEQAGMRAGDRVVKFGSVDCTNHERLSKVAEVVQQNENRPIAVKVLRVASAVSASQAQDLRLTPRRNWGGRGLLGCHLVPV